MAGTTVTLSTADGPMDSYLTVPHGGAKSPAMVVVQEAFGVNTHIRDICRRLAQAGYAAIAPELFHRSGRGIVVDYSDFTKARPYMSCMTNNTISADIQAALTHLRGLPSVRPERIGIIGFCVGGYSAFLAACRTDVATAVCFYGGGIVKGREGFGPPPITEAERIAAPILFFFGSEDPSIPPEDVEAIRSRLASLRKIHEVIVYPGAGHGFHCNERGEYRPIAAADAWGRTLVWLGRDLKS